jgi:hypothetical protein
MKRWLLRLWARQMEHEARKPDRKTPVFFARSRRRHNAITAHVFRQKAADARLSAMLRGTTDDLPDR